MVDNLAELGHSDLILLLELVAQSLAARTVSDLHEVIARMCGHLPTSGAVAISWTTQTMNRLTNGATSAERHSRTKSSLEFLARELRNGNSGTGTLAGLFAMNFGYPDEWLQAYASNNYFASDPNKMAAAAGLGFVRWSKSYARIQLRAQRDFVRQAREFGMAEGVTVVSRQNNSGLTTSLALRTRESDITTREQTILRYMAHHIHTAIVRISPLALDGPVAAEALLSPREVEVLCWAKDGKTNWEISTILGISERTVKFHVQNAMRKLDSSSRAQAVAIALHQRLIKS